MTNNISYCFYDVETLSNIFTVALWYPAKNSVDIFYLDDDNIVINEAEKISGGLRQRILDACPDLKLDVTIVLYDLRQETNSRKLAVIFGLHDGEQGHFLKLDPRDRTGLVQGPGGKPIADVETDKPESKIYLFGYNSANYDTTMLAMYLHETYEPCFSVSGEPCCRFSPTSAKQMRQYNDELFMAEFRNQMPHRLTKSKYNFKTGSFGYSQAWDAIPWLIRKEMLATGRNIDVARLNEKQSKVGLKRILGMLGYRIFEYGHMHEAVKDADDLMDLIAYNISDVVRLETLFKHDVYSSAFKLKRQMLKDYPELIFNKKKDAYAPNEYDPTENKPPDIRRDRLTPDSSSAQFATKTLCPYGKLDDMETVSFLYPSERRARETGVPRVDMLEESDRFFMQNFANFPETIREWKRIYDYYSGIRGKNFNKGRNYREKYPLTPVHELKDMTSGNTNLFYYNADGSASRCFVTFSTGGIHGQEADIDKFREDLAAYETKENLLKTAKAIHPDPTSLAKAKTIKIGDEEYKASKFLRTGSNKTKGEYKEAMSKKAPEIFVEKSGVGWSLAPKYAFTSDTACCHNDFTSYYPLLLTMMDAFHNEGLGYDRYHKMYELKEEYGAKEKKAKSEGNAEAAAVYKLLRDGVKLILNSASGAGDANHPTEIQMNNRIISMRIIGQLFAWRIGQEQTLADGTVPSTNTDGLYAVLNENTNAEIIERIQSSTGIGIEPERVWLISKDTNNRIELSEDKSRILSAKGASLACHSGPDPQKAIAHPAIIDWALAEYITDFGVSCPFNKRAGLRRLESYGGKTDKLIMFQNMVASSHGMRRYVYGEKEPIDPETWNPQSKNQPIALQHYNRVFYVKDRSPDTIRLRMASAKKITAASLAKRLRDGEPRQQNCSLASHVLRLNGASPPAQHEDHEAATGKINSIDDDWNCLIENSDLHAMCDSKKKAIADRLDMGAYLSLLENAYEKNWKNA